MTTTSSPSEQNLQRAREMIGRWIQPNDYPQSLFNDLVGTVASELDAKDGEIERLRGAMNGNLRSRCKHCRHYRVFPCAQHCGCDCDYEPEDRFPALESLLNEKGKKNE